MSVLGAENPFGTATSAVRNIISGRGLSITAVQHLEVWGIRDNGKPFRISRVSDFLKSSEKYDRFYAKWFVSHNRLLGIASSSMDPYESEYLVIDFSGEVIEYGSLFPRYIRNKSNKRQLDNQFKWFALRMNGSKAGVVLQDIVSNSTYEEPFSVIRSPAIDEFQAAGYEIKDLSAFSNKHMVAMSSTPYRTSSFPGSPSRYEAIVCILDMSTNSITKVSIPGSVNIVPGSFSDLLSDRTDGPHVLNAHILSFEVIRPPFESRAPLWAVSISFRDSITNAVHDTKSYVFEWNPEVEPEVVGKEFELVGINQAIPYNIDSAIYDSTCDNVYVTFRLQNTTEAKLLFLDSENRWHHIDDVKLDWEAHPDKALDSKGRLYFIKIDSKSATLENSVNRYDPSTGEIETNFNIGHSKVVESILSNPPN